MSLLHRNILPWARRRVRRELDPRSISGLQLYTDAYALNGSLGYLDSVASWPDWSGLGRTVQQSVGGSQPRFLPWSAAEGNYLHLPGVAGNYASTPDSAAVSITEDIEIIVVAALPSWTPSAASVILAKENDSSTRSYSFFINTNGTLGFNSTADGTTSTVANSTLPVGAPAHALRYLKVTRDVDNGSGQRVTQFFESADGVTWNSIGSVTQTGATSIFNSLSDVRLGATFTGGTSAPLAGRIFYAEVRNGIDGPVVARFDPNRANANSSSFVADTGETWTINRTAIANAARIVSAPVVLGDGTDDRLDVSGVPAFGTGEFTMFAVQSFSNISGGSDAGVISGTTNGPTYHQRNGTRRMGMGKSGVGYVSATAGTNNVDFAQTVHAYRRSGTTGTYFKNGSADGTATDSFDYTVAIDRILNAINLGQLANGYAIYNRALSDAEIRGASRFLARRARAGIVVA
jgi:hypothetical protein